MRRWIAPLMIALFSLAAAADAASPRPLVHPGEPYAKTRARLIRQGYLPVRVVVRRSEAPCLAGLCRRFPEVDECTASGPFVCSFIFQHRPTGRLWEVLANSEISPLARFARPVDPCLLTGVTLQLPDGRRLMYRRWC